MRPSLIGLLAIACIATTGSPIAAESPPSRRTELIDGRQPRLDLDRPSVRMLAFRMAGPEGDSSITVGEARRTIDGVARELLVVMAPPHLRGTSYLVQDSTAEDDVQWLYLPGVGRIRRLVGPQTYAAFLNSDFTDADLGLAPLKTRYLFAGEERRRDLPAYRIEGVPADRSYYTRTVTWITVDSEVPIERHLYDVSDRLWKVERFAGTTVIDGVPTLRRISMEDRQAKTRTDIEVVAVRYDVDVPGALFDPEELPNALSSTVWHAVDGMES